MGTSRRFRFLAVFVFVFSIALAGCGGGDDASYTISGSISGDVTSSVTVTLSGAGSDTTTTDGSGNYSFTGLANGSYTVTPSLAAYSFSPINLAVTISGADSTGNNFTATATATTYSISGQVTGDVQSGVTITLSGSNSGTTLTDGSGNYSFTGLVDGSYIVAPSLAGYTFNPVNLAVTLSGADTTGNDFVGTLAASGSLDTTFDSDGIVIYDSYAFGIYNDVGATIITDSAGRILVTGNVWNGTNSDMAIWRYNADGSPDTTFDSDGIVVHNNAAGGNGTDGGGSIAIDSAGKILVTGSSYDGSSYDMVIWRYNTNGTLDTTFDSDGIVVHNSAAGGDDFDQGYSITIDSAGKILVTGRSFNGINYDMVIWRYNTNGTLDTTFDSDGIVVHDNAAGGNGFIESGYSITIDSDGKILVTGTSATSSSYDMVIWRYNADGTLDTTFDSDGIVVHNNAAGGNGNDSGGTITTDSTGKIFVTGASDAGSNDDMVIWRYNADGTLDSTFDSDGIVVHGNAAGGNGYDYGSSIAIDSDGKILVTGTSANNSNDDMVIWRYNSDGTLDTTFDSDGIVVHNNAAGGNGDDAGFSIATDSAGRILVTGRSWNGTDYDMVIWRVVP